MKTKPFFTRLDADAHDDASAIAEYQKQEKRVGKGATISEIVRLGAFAYAAQNNIPTSVYGGKKKKK